MNKNINNTETDTEKHNLNGKFQYYCTLSQKDRLSSKLSLSSSNAHALDYGMKY